MFVLDERTEGEAGESEFALGERCSLPPRVEKLEQPTTKSMTTMTMMRQRLRQQETKQPKTAMMTGWGDQPQHE
jgi:hypothetical protein